MGRSNAIGASSPALLRSHVNQVTWDVFAVGPRERSLRLVIERGVCGHIRTAVTEGARSVGLEVIEELPVGEGGAPLLCPAVARVGPLEVPLAHRLAGRAVQGRSPSQHGFRPTVLTRVPRLIGFAPQDAEHALALFSLRARTRLIHGAGGLRRVVGQDPPPGARLPHSGVVRLSLAGNISANL